MANSISRNAPERGCENIERSCVPWILKSFSLQLQNKQDLVSKQLGSAYE